MAVNGNGRVTKLVKEYLSTRNERLSLDQQAGKLKVREDNILDELTALGVETGKYGEYNVVVAVSKVPRVTDWQGFYAWVKETNSFDCMFKRVTPSAINARLETGEYVPGVVLDDKVNYRFTLA